jgi:NADPH:quinone reductase
MMKAIAISKPGAPEVLHLCECPIPTLNAGEVLIKVHAAGVNRPDILQRKGAYPPPTGASDLPGLEIAGEIVAGDLTGTEFAMGDLVCALVTGGGYAEYCVAPLAQCLPVPSNLTAIQAAALPETFFTVWSNVFDRASLAGSETLLVQGGTSGIGVTAIQIATALGHTVFATAGSDEKCRACEKLGAARGINYKSEDFVEVINTLTTGRGVNVVLDMVAGDYVNRELSCLAEDGRLVVIGLMGSAKATLDMGMILRKRLTVTGSTLRARPVEFKRAIAQQLRQKIWPLLEQGKIKPVIFQTFPFEQAAQAHALMESSAHIGKIVLAMKHDGTLVNR